MGASGLGNRDVEATRHQVGSSREDHVGGAGTPAAPCVAVQHDELLAALQRLDARPLVAAGDARRQPPARLTRAGPVGNALGEHGTAPEKTAVLVAGSRAVLGLPRSDRLLDDLHDVTVGDTDRRRHELEVRDRRRRTVFVEKTLGRSRVPRPDRLASLLV